MHSGGKSAGFTLLEVILFIAITGVLLVSALNAIGGRRTGVEFQQGIRDIESKMNDVINQVASGYYPSNDSVLCTAPGTGAPIVTSGSSPLGSSNQCVYLGKVVQFTPDNPNSSDYNVISVAARRLASNGREASSLAESFPTAVANTQINITEKFVMPYGLKITAVKDAAGGTVVGGSVAFFGSFPNRSASGALKSGAQHVSVGIVPGTSVGQSLSSTVARINNLSAYADSSILDRPEGVKICIGNDNNSKRARITLGGTSSGQTTTNLEVLNTGAPC